MAFNPISAMFGKKGNYAAEYKRFKNAMERNPRDHGLKAQFIKFCLLNRFTKNEINKNHIAEALALFETIEHADDFDLQCHYLVGKYYQEDKDFRKAYQIYLDAVQHFNRYVEKNPVLKSENVEMVYSIALNLMTLQTNPNDPELERCFKIIHKSYPLHVKRFEFEGEMAKPAPDKDRIKQLTEEIRLLKAEEEKESLAAAKERESAAAVEVKAAEKSAPKPVEKEDIFTKLFRVPVPKDLIELNRETQNQQGKFEKEEKEEHFKLSPVSETSGHPTSFMVFQNGDWEGPFTLSQLREKGNLDPATWVCRVGSQMVNQAYEVADLHSLIK